MSSATQTEVSQSPQLGLCCSSIAIVAVSVILLLAMLLLTLFVSVHAWEVVFPQAIPMWQWSIEDHVCACPGKMHCHHFKINLEEVEFSL
jgi:hypothetical protein